MLDVLTLGLAMLLEPIPGDWRLISDDPGNAILAVETSRIAGPSSRREVTTAAANGATLDTGRYVVARVTIDCDRQQTTLVSVEVRSLDGALLATLDPDDLESTTAPTGAASPSAVALACEGAPVTTRSFSSDVEFIDWAAKQPPAP